MADLLTFTAEEPETPEKTAVWLDFRCACAKQLAQCKACAREYHRAVASWELELSKEVPRKLAQRRIRALVCWDFERLHPRLRRSPLLGGGAASDGLTIAEARQAEALCRDAFLECLLSFRLCMNPKMAETIADLFKRGTVVRTKEDVKPFIVDFGMLPSGLMALCFSQAFTVRAWAKRILAEACPFPELADPHARSYLLRKAISHFSGPSKPKSKGESSMRTTEEARKAAWDGFGAVFVHLRKKDIHTFLKSVPDTNVIETLLSAVVDVDGAISSVAIDCAMIVLTQLRPGELDAPDLLRETSFLDGIINYFHTRANVAKKSNYYVFCRSF